MAIALTATAHDAGGYVALALTDAGTSSYTIIRTDGSGNTTAVRNGDPAVASGGSWVGNDYEAPLDESLTYTATLTTTPFTVTTAGAVTLDGADSPWLGHPGKPSLNIRPLVADLVIGARAARAQFLAVLGRSRPIGQSIRRAGAAGDLKLRITGQDELNALDALLDDGGPLLLRGPVGWVGYGNRYLQIGEVTYERLTRVGTDGRFLVTLPWTEVDRPAGTAEGGAGFRWADVLAAYDTWDELVAANTTWLDVMNGVP